MGHLHCSASFASATSAASAAAAATAATFMFLSLPVPRTRMSHLFVPHLLDAQKPPISLTAAAGLTFLPAKVLFVFEHPELERIRRISVVNAMHRASYCGCYPIGFEWRAPCLYPFMHLFFDGYMRTWKLFVAKLTKQ
jgi:hypothetical protein